MYGSQLSTLSGQRSEPASFWPLPTFSVGAKDRGIAEGTKQLAVAILPWQICTRYLFSPSGNSTFHLDFMCQSSIRTFFLLTLHCLLPTELDDLRLRTSQCCRLKMTAAMMFCLLQDDGPDCVTSKQANAVITCIHHGCHTFVNAAEAASRRL
jgi:hypothetical protein